MNRCFSALLLLVNLFFSASCFSHQYSLTFNRPQSTPQADYALELLKLAYADIGFKIHIIDFSRKNALLAANNGVLDGQLGRDISVEQDYKNLVRVNYELFKFDLILYKTCLPNKLEQLESIAIVDAYPVQERYLASTKFAGSIIKVKSISTQLNLLAQQKVQGALMVDFVPENNSAVKPKSCFEKEVLTTYPLYHYLNKNNKNLVDKLEKSLINLTNNGTVYALKAKYGLNF
ncbi:transporter substrate-binding domain-containing protein [Pseudoalteromonas carrageenovora]|uniref:transporter substrate-binding domain-containing protein n=1 Tax=Pseudoalteromonas carrageenovora TaxID=227 RepID=UPI002117E951|nr:transporter substrate-binding domain-containing protein [Pseudoalteromonas carrageenovora]MCQ8889507.1 transporter substrate-binding domain-containing protein [Pseudoalteromonas carrageenovora]